MSLLTAVFKFVTNVTARRPDDVVTVLTLAPFTKTE